MAERRRTALLYYLSSRGAVLGLSAVASAISFGSSALAELIAEATFDGLGAAACDCGWCSIAVFRHALQIPQSFEADSTWPELVLAHHVMA